MADDEFIKFEITEEDLENEFTQHRPRRLTKHQQIYGKEAFKFSLIPLNSYPQNIPSNRSYFVQVFGQIKNTMMIATKMLENRSIEKARKIFKLL